MSGAPVRLMITLGEIGVLAIATLSMGFNCTAICSSGTAPSGVSKKRICPEVILMPQFALTEWNYVQIVDASTRSGKCNGSDAIGRQMDYSRGKSSFNAQWSFDMLKRLPRSTPENQGIASSAILAF